MPAPDPISVVIPCFNRVECIAHAIESVLVDSPTAELIVIDDGSTDDSWNVIQRFDGLIARRTANRGVSAARNLGIHIASRPFLRFLDSDDRLAPGSTEKLLRGAATQQAPVGRADHPGYGFPELRDGAAIPVAKLFGRPLPMGLALIPRECVLSAGGFNERLTIGEDQELAVRLAQSGLRFLQIDEVVYSVGESAANRVTRAVRSKFYDAHLDMVSILARRATIEDERQSLGRQAWRLGRMASIDRLPDRAAAFFTAARDLGGSRVVNGPKPLMILYGLFDPYHSEQIFASAKRLVRL